MTTTALVRYRRRKTCPDCHAKLRPISWTRYRLFWMYGDGYAITETLLMCTRCTYRRHHSTTSENPTN